MLKKILVIGITLLMPILSWSQSESQSKLATSPIVDSITIRGLWRSNENIVRRELLFREGDSLTTVLLLESLQDLKNLQIFSYVRPFITLLPNNRVNVTIEVSEKWTTIPFMSYRQGGGTEYFYVGLYDINTLGKYVETGFQYENWNGEHGGVVWFRNPRFMNQRMTVGADIWATQKPTFLYTTSGKDQGEFILRQRRLNLLVKKEWTKYFETGILMEYTEDELHSFLFTDEIDARTLNTLNQYPQANTLLNTLTVRVGKLDYDIDLITGQRSELLLSHSNRRLVSDYSFNKVKWVSQAYWPLKWRSYIATNFTLAATDTPLLQQYYNVGGFEHIRGYLTGQFRNRSYWQWNTEYRIPSYRSQWIILQHIFFLDIANSTDNISDLGDVDENIYSGGIGLRLISPKIYSFNGRIDFALLTSQKSELSLSFGTQHFF